jgi:hypothetical protein
VKLNSLVAKPLRLRGVQLAALGSIAFVSQIGCSDEAGPPAAPPFGSSGTAATTGGTSGTGTAGTSATAGTGTGGTFGTAGTGTAGTGTAGTFGTSGSATGGTGGTGTAGTAGSTAGTGGTAEPPKPFCDTQTAVTLPYEVNKSYQLSEWGGIAPTPVTPGTTAPTIITVNEGVMPAVTGCATRVQGAVGQCSSWKYTPPVAPAEPGPLWVAWVRQWDPMYQAPAICMPTTAKAVTFSAKGELGGEKILVSAGGGAQKKEITLTAEWATYFVSVDGIQYNSFLTGADQGFAWELAPTAETPSFVFYLDNLQWVAEAPAE